MNISVPCRDFGTVTFSENGNTADFVRVAKDYVKPGDLLEYIRTYCSNQARIEKLGLVVSVHGSVGDKLINESQVLTGTFLIFFFFSSIKRHQKKIINILLRYLKHTL